MRSKSNQWILSTLVILFPLVSFYASAMDTGEKKESHEGSHSEHHHHIAALVGATSNLDSKHTEFTLGGDYHYRLASRWAIGGFGEAIFADHTEYLLGVPLYFFPTSSFWLRAGPGVEFAKEPEQNHSRSSSSEGHVTSETKFLFRFGAGYNFEVGGLTITPNLDVDLVRSANALV